MYEFHVPVEFHIQIPADLPVQELIPPAIATAGDFAAELVRAHLGLSQEPESAEQDLRFFGSALASLVDAELERDVADEMLLLGAAAFYLSGMPGNSHVLVKRIAESGTQLSVLQRALHWALQARLPEEIPGLFEDHHAICRALRVAHDGREKPILPLDEIRALRSKVYSEGTPEDLLIVDLLSAVVISRIQNSTAVLLPRFAGSDPAAWAEYLRRPSALRELWPSQVLLGAAGAFLGQSMIVQMPTSAGKTKAIELVIRSAFVANRTDLAVVVAPFRALSEEISESLRVAFDGEAIAVGRFSDALQADFFDELLQFLSPYDQIVSAAAEPNVVVLTPEKLLYILRQRPELTAKIGLIIYDEGHQFDSGARGVTYELLITSIRQIVGGSAQSILISAVVENPAALAHWLLSDEAAVVSDGNSQTQRGVAFCSWQHELGQIQFQDLAEDLDSYFVPRVIVSQRLQLFGSETRERRFPERGRRPPAFSSGTVWSPGLL